MENLQNPLPPPDPHQPPQLTSVMPGSYPTGEPEPGSLDWLWFHPGIHRAPLTLYQSQFCRPCDVTFAYSRSSTGKPRCWNCGKFTARYPAGR